MGCKRKLWMFRGNEALYFESFADARRYFGIESGNFPDCAVKRGHYKGWKVVAGDTPYHGMYGTSLYGSWVAMKTRCTNENYPEWIHYGGRGIKLCSEWYEFIPFMEWAMANGYEDGLTIERIDVNGDYCPNNCCWIPRTRQPYNKTNSRKFVVDGAEKTLAELAEEHDISRTTVTHRLNFGWTIEDALTRERKKWHESGNVTYRGETLSYRQWSKRTGINESTIAKRIQHGWTAEDALTTPPDARNRKQKYKIKWDR